MRFLRSIFGGNERQLRDTIEEQKAAISTLIKAKLDVAQTTDENRRHWAYADHLSPDAALLPEVRRTVRARARYEHQNNAYLAGMASTWSNDLVGTGPRLHLDLGPDVDDQKVRRVELANYDWSVDVDLAKKLRIAKVSKLTDGESFGLLTTNRRLQGVQLDLRFVEADQCMSPYGLPSENDADGVRFDDNGVPVAYWISRYHPGSVMPGFSLQGRWIPADRVLHWYHATRPGQHRGLGEIVPALSLFAMLRRYTLAVVQAAETAADFAAIIKTTLGADGTAAAVPEWETMPITRGMATSLPEGWDAVQMRPEQPVSTYSEFVKRLLNEIGRSIDMPYIVASLDSSAASYSAMRGDYLVYRKRINTERSDLERVVLDPLLREWLDEAAMVPGLIPDGLPPVSEWNWSWSWDGFEHVDPVKEVEAEIRAVEANTSTLAEVCQKRNKDWRAVMRQRAVEKALADELGLTPVVEPTQSAAVAEEDDTEDDA